MAEFRHASFRQGKKYSVDDLIAAIRTGKLARNLPAHMGTVADFGCGFDARFVRRLLDTGRAENGIAVDLSLDAALMGDHLTLVEADLNTPLPLESESLDVACSLAVLEHLDHPDVHLRELYRMLRPGGTLLLTTPSPRAKPVLEFIAYDLHIIDAAEIRDHKQYFNEAGLRASLHAAGFDPARTSYKKFLFGMNQLVVAVK